jgi:hypothetical protein
MARRLVDLIETHADELTSRLVEQLKSHRTTIGLRRYDDLELGRRARELYHHLGWWLRSSSEPDVEKTFRNFGRVERGAGIPVSDLVGALLLTRRNLWDYVETMVGDSILDLRQELDLQLLVVRFFDRAIYHTVRGFEEAGEAGAPAPGAAQPAHAARAAG